MVYRKQDEMNRVVIRKEDVELIVSDIGSWWVWPSHPIPSHPHTLTHHTHPHTLTPHTHPHTLTPHTPSHPNPSHTPSHPNPSHPHPHTLLTVMLTDAGDGGVPRSGREESQGTQRRCCQDIVYSNVICPMNLNVTVTVT